MTQMTEKPDKTVAVGHEWQPSDFIAAPLLRKPILGRVSYNFLISQPFYSRAPSPEVKIHWDPRIIQIPVPSTSFIRSKYTGIRGKPKSQCPLHRSSAQNTLGSAGNQNPSAFYTAHQGKIHWDPRKTHNPSASYTVHQVRILSEP